MIGAGIQCSDYSVLICDDEESIRSMLAEAVGGWGFQVATAPNGEAALEYLQQGNLPHVVLTDIRMGGITGIELAKRVKEMSPEVEVVIMTSHGTFETAVQAMRIGVFDYISKPFDNIEDVRTTLVHVCERIYLKFYNEYLLQEVQRKSSQIEQLAQLAEELSKSLDVEKSMEIGLAGLHRAFQCPAVFFQYSPKQKSLLAATRYPRDTLGGMQVRLLLPNGIGDSEEALRTYCEGLSKNPDFLRLLQQAGGSKPLSSCETRGLFTRSVFRGVFVLLRDSNWSDDESHQFDRYVQTIATSFENALLHARVLQTAIRDSLTGLYNVRYFKERFQIELVQAYRLGHPVSLLFFDVDHFKKYNDTHGHPAGDQVLRMVADLMKKNFRSTDTLARYGGEEFVVLMPHTSFVDAQEKAESFRLAVEQYRFPNEHTQPLGKVTVSVGVSEFPSCGGDLESVIKAADDALYEGKKQSRNCVVSGRPAPGYVPAFVPKQIRSRVVEESSDPSNPTS